MSLERGTAQIPEGAHAPGEADLTLPARLVAAAADRGATIATAESLTAGLVSATIASIPGSSAVLRGGVVCYATSAKHDLLGLPADMLEHVVSQRVAEAMAVAVAQRLGTDLGLATTGVAGPDWLDDQPPGTVWIAVADNAAARVHAQLLACAGDRAAVRTATVTAVLAAALAAVQGLALPGTPGA